MKIKDKKNSEQTDVETIHSKYLEIENNVYVTDKYIETAISELLYYSSIAYGY